MKSTHKATKALANHDSLKLLEVACHIPEETSEAMLSQGQKYGPTGFPRVHVERGPPDGICTEKMLAAYST